MLSKTLSFNRGIFVQAARSVGWIGISYFLLLFFAIPLQLMMAYTRENTYYHDYYFNRIDSIFSIHPEIQLIFMFTVPVLLSIFVFRYMQVKLSADYMHGLPIRRESLFHQYVVFSSIILVTPLILTGVVLFVLRGFIEAQTLLSFSNIVSWIGLSLLINLFVYFCGVFVAMFSGMSVLQAALTYILFMFPAGITVLFLSNLKYYLFGLNVDFILSQNIDRLVPFLRAFDLMRANYFPGKDILVFLILTIIAYVIALVVYRMRHTEAATQAVTFRPLRPIFLYGVTTCIMLLGGLYFGETQDHHLGWITFGYIAGSIIGYVIAQIILEKTWRIFDKWKGYVAFVAAMTVLGVAFHLDITGFEKRVPSAENVERVYFADSMYNMRFYPHRDVNWTDSHGRPFGQPDYYFEQPETIALIQNLHQQLIDDRHELKNKYIRNQSVSIVYQMKNGKEIARQYRIPNNSYQELYQPIISSKEFKYNYFPLLRIDDISKLNSITFGSHYLDRRVTISDRDQLAELHKLLQSEMLNDSVSLSKTRDGWGYIEYNWQGNASFSFDWSKDYVNIDAWLLENDLLSKARYTSQDISHIYVYSNAKSKEIDEYRMKDANFDIERLDFVLKIEDNAQIDEALRLTSWSYDYDSYIVQIHFEATQYPFTLNISSEHAPSFITNSLR